MKGVRIHTFEHRLSEKDFVLQYTVIRCIVLDGDRNTNQIKIHRISNIFSELIKTEALYELYVLCQLVFEGDHSDVKYAEVGGNNGVGDIMKTSEFMTQVNKYFQESFMSQILLYETEPDDIEGLPQDLTEITMILSLNCLTDGTTETISDDDVIIISE